MALGQNSRLWRRLRLLGLGVAMAGATACAATFNNHGYIPPEDDLAVILPGVDTRESVELSVGRPSAAGIVRAIRGNPAPPVTR